MGQRNLFLLSLCLTAWRGITEGHDHAELLIICIVRVVVLVRAHGVSTPKHEKEALVSVLLVSASGVGDHSLNWDVKFSVGTTWVGSTLIVNCPAGRVTSLEVFGLLNLGLYIHTTEGDRTFS